ncbi:MAG: hypothetical protein KGL46_00070 [Hyphomicrobiales bacterium]|nr:hypothetical protein [Hyphomicrobiales bacterium]
MRAHLFSHNFASARVRGQDSAAAMGLLALFAVAPVAGMAAGGLDLARLLGAALLMPAFLFFAGAIFTARDRRLCLNLAAVGALLAWSADALAQASPALIALAAPAAFAALYAVLSRWRATTILVIAVVLHVLAAVRGGVYDRTIGMFLFYVVGVLAGAHRSALLRRAFPDVALGALAPVALAACAIVFAAHAAPGRGAARIAEMGPLAAVFGAAMGPALLAAADAVETPGLQDFLARLGRLAPALLAIWPVALVKAAGLLPKAPPPASALLLSLSILALAFLALDSLRRSPRLF